MVTRNDERVTCHLLSWISEIVVPTAMTHYSTELHWNG